MIDMKYDEVADAAYITLGHNDPTKFHSVRTASSEFPHILLDFDKDGKLIGIEVLSASKNLDPSLIEYLKKIENMRKESHSYLSPGC